MEAMSTTMEDLDLKRYGRLLARAVPKVIKTEEENERALAVVESLMEKGERTMTPEEDALLELLTELIHDFEEKAGVPDTEIRAARDGCVSSGTARARPKGPLARSRVQEPGLRNPCRKTARDERAGEETRRVFPCRRRSVYLSEQALGISRITLSSGLNGRAGISPEMAVRLSIALQHHR